MLASLFRADGPDDRSPFGDFWFTPLGARSASGMRVTPEGAMRLTAVFRSVSLLAGTMACLPFVLYRRKDNGGKERITDDWRYRLFARRPNRWQNAFEWREMMQGHLALRGNGYNEIVDGPRGTVAELVPMHPDRVSIELLPNGSYRYKVKQRDGSERLLAREQVFHLRGLSSDGIAGLSPLELARDAIGGALAAQEYAARFFKNDARPLGGWIEYPGHFKDKDARSAFRESWQQGQGGENRGKTAVLEDGMKWHEVGLNNRDSQFIEIRQLSVADIARIFGVQPHLIGDLSRATNNNIEQQALEFVMYTMTHWAERWECAIESTFIGDDEDLEVEFDFANLLRGDSAARAEFYASGINAGWLVRNEARIRENLDPLPGLDEPLQPLNMVPADKTPAKPEPDKPQPAQDSDGDEPDGDDEAKARLNALELAGAGRVVRKEVVAMRKAHERYLGQPEAWRAAVRSFYQGHVDFVVATLLCATETAAAWCERQAAALAAATDEELQTREPRIATVLEAWDTSAAAELAARIHLRGHSR